MASRSISPRVWTGFGSLFGGLAGNIAPRVKSQPSPQERLAERDLVKEMIWNNPEAFASELDVQNMMSMYPGRY